MVKILHKIYNFWALFKLVFELVLLVLVLKRSGPNENAIKQPIDALSSGADTLALAGLSLQPALWAV